MRWLSDLINPVLPAIVPEVLTGSNKGDLFACDNSACCASLPWGLLKCPRCNQQQRRVRPIAVEVAQS